ncbi:MAG: ribonuclease R [Bacteroidetes bacterium]|jgi:ribonuclease R|nr:ribonuclease R [Bacteroidota bacterium]
MAKKKKKRPGKESGKINKNALTNSILGIFGNEPQKTYNYKQIAAQLMVRDAYTKKLINEMLIELKNEGRIEELYRGKYKLKSKAGYISGTVQLTSSQNAFVVSPDLNEDIFISHNHLNHALHGDTVKVYLYARRKKRHLEGEVVEVIHRSKATFVGLVEISKNFAFLIPDSRNMPYDLFIPLEHLKGAKNGQKAIAKITDWPKKAKNPFGEIVDVLGFPGENETEMHAILAEFELPYKFPDEVNKAAEKIPDEITPEEIAKRRDFRQVPTFTIDPHDAQDFDDALSIQKLKNGNWEIGIHIADVSHYVHPGTIINEEAEYRATSVYLVDRVVPMLPEKLSNGVCSLRPKEEKLCFSAVFEMNEQAEIMDEWFGRTVIYSDRRFAYEEAQEVIEKRKGDMKNELLILHQMAQILRAERFRNGSIAFERDEVKFNLDEKGKPVGVFFKEMKESNQLIEEFMLLANKRVAAFIGDEEKNKKPPTFVYRIHDLPNMEKLESFAYIIHKFGHRILLTSGKKIQESLNKLLEDVRNKPEQHLVETLALRSMAKAEYSTDNIGHYGLAFKYYTHFTSPIRRYPDMMVHRLLAHYLEGGKSKSEGKYEELCRHSSEMEKLATDVERASIKYKQVEFMQDKIGQFFEGIISGVTEWGFFVEIIDNKCEGLVAMRELLDDYYIFDEENYTIHGRHTGKTYQLGDKVRVEILRANLAKKQLDFAVVDEETEDIE